MNPSPHLMPGLFIKGVGDGLTLGKSQMTPIFVNASLALLFPYWTASLNLRFDLLHLSCVHIIFLIWYFAAAPLFTLCLKCPVLAPVTLRRPYREAESALIGQLGYAPRAISPVSSASVCSQGIDICRFSCISIVRITTTTLLNKKNATTHFHAGI